MLKTNSTFCYGITCQNRESLYYKTLQSLKRMSEELNILIIDDCSTTIDHQVTKSIFPNANIVRTKEPTGRADFAMHFLMKTFLERNEDYLVIIDSDMIVAKDCQTKLSEIAEETDGLFSLFNTPSHPVISNSQRWVEKSSFGAAGAVIHRTIVQKIIDHVPASIHFDWDWCNWAKNAGIRLLVVKDSLVQHMGLINGQNSSSYTLGDFGHGFYDYNDSNKTSVIESFYDVMLSTQKRMNKIERTLKHLTKSIDKDNE